MFSVFCHLSSRAHQQFPCHLYLFSVRLGFFLQRPAKVIVLQGEMPWHQLLGSWKSRAASRDNWGPALSGVTPSYVRCMWKSPGCCPGIASFFPQQLRVVKKGLLMCLYVQWVVVSLEVNRGCAVGFCFLLIFFTSRKPLVGVASHGHFLKYIPSLEESAKYKNTSVYVFKSVHAFKRENLYSWMAFTCCVEVFQRRADFSSICGALFPTLPVCSAGSGSPTGNEEGWARGFPALILSLSRQFLGTAGFGISDIIPVKQLCCWGKIGV